MMKNKPENEVACLYVVATPIGNLSDMSARAVEVLQTVTVIAAEDTRHSSYLLQHYSISTPTVSLHEHNEKQRSEVLLSRLQQGESVALISDAGTPLISDPGFRLVSLLKQHDIPVVPIPGSCALIAALSASGLPSDSFAFEGFLPPKLGARQQALQKLADESRTLIFYESPKRLKATLTDMVGAFGETRRVCLARELTKIHETIVTKPITELLDWVTADQYQQKGECVVLVEGAYPQDKADVEINRVLTLLLTELSVKKSAAMSASLLGISKNKAYDMALKLQQK